MDGVRDGSIVVGNDIILAMDYYEKKLDDPDVFIDTVKIEKAVELMERYFEVKLFDWELFATALIHCFKKSNDTVLFDTFLIVMGRGNGKNGFISPISWYLTTHYHGIKGYNIDIVANAEDQAKTSFDDVYEVLEKHWKKLKRFFYKSKELIKNTVTNSYIRYNTSNAKTKDSKRTGCLIFDEVHQYETYDNIKVFTSSFGKRKHSRAFYISTNGNIRDGVLDDMLKIAEEIIAGTITDLDWAPLIYRIDSEAEAADPKMWHKANPSMKYLPELQKEIKSMAAKMKYQPALEEEFFTKRMNWPKQRTDMIVATWENIKATNRELPDLTGWKCTVGIDYAKVTDFVSVDFHFKKEEMRYDISHSWLCLSSTDIPRFKVPYKQWADEGRLTLVDDVEISPYLITDYIQELGAIYAIQGIAVDNFRYALLAEALKTIGFDAKERKNVKLIRPSDIMQVVPIIDSLFANQKIIWGDEPILRWATNNTKLIPSGRKQKTDTGNYYYGKIEAKSRKTDPFMAEAHATCLEDLLQSTAGIFGAFDVITI